MYFLFEFKVGMKKKLFLGLKTYYSVRICMLHSIEELSDLILKNSRLLLKIEYEISLKPDCFNIHHDGSVCDVTAPDTVYYSDRDVTSPDTVYGY